MQPQGEKTRKAVRWISDLLKDQPDASPGELVIRAITKFDLNPKESEELMQFYKRAEQNR